MSFKDVMKRFWRAMLVLSPTFLVVFAIVFWFAWPGLASWPDHPPRTGFKSEATLLAAARDRASRSNDAPGIFVDGQKVDTLKDAILQAHPGSRIQLNGVILHEAGVLDKPGLSLIAHGSALYGSAIRGKAALIVKAPGVSIVGLECFSIVVADQNGACVRVESGDLTLRNVWFHDSQSGVSANDGAGAIRIYGSRFERLGNGGGDPGRSQPVSVGRIESLTLVDSRILSTLGEGHDLRSGARQTEIRHCVIASLDGRDSHAIDVTNGGELSILNSVIEKGPASSSREMIYYDLGKSRGSADLNLVRVGHSTFISDTGKPTRLIGFGASASKTPVAFTGVKAVGPFMPWLPKGTGRHLTRGGAGLPAFPAVPEAPKPRPR